MPRPARFSADDVLDAALAAVVEHGPQASVNQMAEKLGGPIGSIYHRFPSREALIIRLWLRCVRRFHEELFPLAHGSDPRQAVLDIARLVPSYCRTHRAEAVGLHLCNQQRLLAGDLDAELRTEVETVNVKVAQAMLSVTERLLGNTDPDAILRVDMAAVTVPYGAVRPYLGRDVPALLDTAVVAAAAAILDA